MEKTKIIALILVMIFSTTACSQIDPIISDSYNPADPKAASLPTPFIDVWESSAGNLPIEPTTIEGGMIISNQTMLTVEEDVLLTQPLTQSGKTVLIIHTHGTEAFTPENINSYDPSNQFKSSNKDESIIAVGAEFAKALENHGINVIHDTEFYDHPDYDGSYENAAQAILGHLEENSDIGFVFDLHRDAIGDETMSYKTVAETGDEPCAQIMLLVGTDEGDSEHPDWEENLKLALQFQSAAVETHNTLMRPLLLRNDSYNQELSIGSLLLEVGTNVNTLNEAKQAVRLFADAIAPVLSDLK